MNQFPPVPIDNAPEPVQDELHCASCGYDLRGLTADMRCPECGAPVSRSTRGNYLRYSDPEWMGKLAMGTSLLRWSLLAQILLPLLAKVVGAAFVGIQSAGFLLLITLASLAAMALGVWAAFLITTQEPRVALHEDPLTLRNLVRYSALIYFIGQVIATPAEFQPAGRFAWLLKVIGGLLILGSLVSFFGQFVYFRRFALRIPDPKLARDTRTVMWGFVISYAILLLGGLLAMLIGAWAVGGTAAAAGGSVFACVGFAAVLFFVCWAYRLLLKYVKAFKLAAQEAHAVETAPA